MKKIFSILLLMVSVADAQTNIVKMEYWLDIDPGFDNAIPIPGFNQQTNVSFQFPIDTILTEGFHVVGIRTQDSTNVWSQTSIIPIYVADSSAGLISTLEYFWNIDNGFGNNGTDTILSTPVPNLTNGILNVLVNLSLFSHDTLYVRSKDNRGRWSQTNYVDTTFYVAGVVSTDELASETGINVYPNPFNDAITVNPKLNEPSRIILSDENGKIVFDKVINQETKINTEFFTCGVYSIFAWDAKHKIYRTTVIKQ